MKWKRKRVGEIKIERNREGKVARKINERAGKRGKIGSRQGKCPWGRGYTGKGWGGGGKVAALSWYVKRKDQLNYVRSRTKSCTVQRLRILRALCNVHAEIVPGDPEVTANIYGKSSLPIQMRKITVQICGNFWVTQYPLCSLCKSYFYRADLVFSDSIWTMTSVLKMLYKKNG